MLLSLIRYKVSFSLFLYTNFAWPIAFFYIYTLAYLTVFIFVINNNNYTFNILHLLFQA